jgi:hypothetical protein
MFCINSMSIVQEIDEESTVIQSPDKISVKNLLPRRCERDISKLLLKPDFQFRAQFPERDIPLETLDGFIKLIDGHEVYVLPQDSQEYTRGIARGYKTQDSSEICVTNTCGSFRICYHTSKIKDIIVMGRICKINSKILLQDED